MPVAIAGMHRSGTSMVARFLHVCGLDLGPADQLMKPAADNPEGFWECLPFVHLNERVLGEFGGTWDAPPPRDSDWEGCQRLVPFREWAARLPRELGMKEPWGWKDPRTTLACRFWSSVWPDLRVVLCVRHPLEVAHSIFERNGMPFLAALRLWHQYHEAVLADVPAERLFVCHYESFFASPEMEAHRLLSWLGMPVDDERVRAASATVANHLRHNRFAERDLEGVGAPAEVVSVYARLCAAAGLNAEWSGTPTPGSASALRAARLSINLEARIDDLEGRIRVMAAEMNDLRGQLAQTTFERDEARIYGEDRDRWLRAMVDRLAARRHRYADAVVELMHRVRHPAQKRPLPDSVPAVAPPWRERTPQDAATSGPVSTRN